MGNIIYLREVRIKKDLIAAERALGEARELVIRGVDVPGDLLIRLENVIKVLEEELENYITNLSD